MADPKEELPEEMGEQQQRLIGDLCLLYRADAEKAQHLTSIQQRLLDHEIPLRPRLGHDATDRRQRSSKGKAARSSMIEKQSWGYQLSTIAAVLVVTLVVGSLLLVLSLSHRRGTSGTTAKPTGGFTTLLSLHMIDALTGWALTDHAVLYTTDGAVHWNNVTPPGATLTQSSIADFHTASIASIATPRPDGASTQVMHSTDGGQTWQQATIPMPFPRQISFVDAQHGWLLTAVRPPVGAAEPIRVFRTMDGGKNWTTIATALFADTTPPGHLPYGGQKTGMRFLDRLRGWVTGTVPLTNRAWLYVTHDGGSTWQQQDLLLPPGVPSAQLTVLSPTFFSSTDGILPVIFSDLTTNSTMATAVYTTHDGGKTWQGTAPISAPLPLLSFAEMQHGWATNGTLLYGTGDGGTHWQQLAPNGRFKHIAQLDFVSATLGWAMSSTASTPSTLLKTDDGGQTWTSVPFAIA